jgi:hypothetical protein
MTLTADDIIRQEEETVALMEDHAKAEAEQVAYFLRVGNIAAALYHADRVKACEACADIARQQIAAIRESAEREVG